MKETKESKELKETIESKELVKKEESSLIITDEMEQEMLNCVGITGSMQATDLILPYVSTMQTGSELVKNEKCRPGSIAHNILQKELGYKNQGMLFVPLKVAKKKVFIKDQKRIGMEDWLPDTKIDWDRPKKDGISEFETDYYYILTKEDLDTKAALPSIFTYNKSALREQGRKFRSLLFTQSLEKNPGWFYFFEMTTYLYTKEKNSWYIPKIELTNIALTREQRFRCYEWFKTLNENILLQNFNTQNLDTDEPVGAEEMDKTSKEIYANL